MKWCSKEPVWFDDKKYEKKVRNMTPDELWTRECLKYRTKVSSGCGIAFSGLAVLPSLGVSVVGLWASGRTLDIARRKMKIVKHELDRRNLAHYRRKKRDVLIPLGISAAVISTVGVIDILCFGGTSSAIVNAFAPHGPDAVAAVAQDPGTFLPAAAHGVKLQAQQFFHVGGNHMAVNGAELYSNIIANGMPGGVHEGAFQQVVHLSGNHMAGSGSDLYSNAIANGMLGGVDDRVFQLVMPSVSPPLDPSLLPGTSGSNVTTLAVSHPFVAAAAGPLPGGVHEAASQLAVPIVSPPVDTSLLPGTSGAGVTILAIDGSVMPSDHLSVELIHYQLAAHESVHSHAVAILPAGTCLEGSALQDNYVAELAGEAFGMKLAKSMEQEGARFLIANTGLQEVWKSVKAGAIKGDVAGSDDENSKVVVFGNKNSQVVESDDRNFQVVELDDENSEVMESERKNLQVVKAGDENFDDAGDENFKDPEDENFEVVESDNKNFQAVESNDKNSHVGESDDEKLHLLESEDKNPQAMESRKKWRLLMRNRVFNLQFNLVFLTHGMVSTRSWHHLSSNAARGLRKSSTSKKSIIKRQFTVLD